MKNKFLSLSQIPDLVKNGMTIMVGGFAGIGVPTNLIHAVCDSGIKDLEIIADDFSPENHGCSEGLNYFLKKGAVRRAKMSFIGTSKTAIDMVRSGKLDIEFIPQGTLVERIHAGGCGLGGFYTPTGIGTDIAAGKEIRIIDGKEFLFELPLTADVALLKAYRADAFGNAQFLYTGSNFNLHMAMASKKTILEVEEITELGAIDPSFVHLPGIFVDHIVLAEEVII